MKYLINCLSELYNVTGADSRVQLSQTRKEFEGDYTVVIFPFVKQIGKSPVEIGDALGSYVVQKIPCWLRGDQNSDHQ